MLKYINLFVLLVLFGASTALAVELVVVDSNGLTRARKDVKGAAIIELKTRGESLPVLKNIDGGLGEVKAEGSAGVFSFKGVTSGTWKVSFPDKKGRLLSVRIKG